MRSSSRPVRRLALGATIAALGLAVAAPASYAGTDTQTVIDATNALQKRIVKTAKHPNGSKQQIAKLQKSLPDLDAPFTQSAYGLSAGDVLDDFMFADSALDGASEVVRDGGLHRLVDQTLRYVERGALNGLGEALQDAQGGTSDPAPQALLDALLAVENSIEQLRSELKDLGDEAIEKRIDGIGRAKSQLREQYFQQDLGGVPLAAISAKVDAIGGALEEAEADAIAHQPDLTRANLKRAAKACSRFVNLLQGALAAS